MKPEEAREKATDPDDCPKLEAVNIAIEKVHGAKTDAEMFDPLCDLYDAGYAQAKGEWVPVEEKLPEKDGPYLVTLHNTRIKATHPELEFMVEVRNFQIDWFQGAEYSHRRVIAWRPVPEPYVKEER